MAQIVNRSGREVEVFGVDTTSGMARRWILAPGRQTDASFNATQLRAVDGSDVEVFGSRGWWGVATNYVFVYSPHGGGGFFSEDLSLHCVPFVPKTGTAPPWKRCYEPAAADTTRDGTPVTDPIHRDPEFPIPHADLGVTQGELGPVYSGALGFYAFGLQTRTRMGMHIFISVRLSASPSSSLTDAERLRLSGDSNNPSQLDRWKEKIETVWATAAKATTGETLHFECVWVESGSHYNVDIIPAKGTFFRSWTDASTMEWWLIDIDDSNQNQDRFYISAHEFGHYLGLDDGYYLPYEIPRLEAEELIKTFLAKDKTVETLAADPKLIRRTAGFWGTFLSTPGLYSLFARPDRVPKRLGHDQKKTKLNLMENSTDLDPALIDEELVDAIVTRQLQPLYYAAELFFTTKPPKKT